MDRIKVLIADDVDETRELIRKILSLKEDEFQVVGEANNGEMVLSAIPRCKPDIVLMDINMPIMNGLEATEIVTDKFPEVSVVIMSVQSDSEYLKSAMFAGASGYIIKPINYDELVETIVATYNKNKERKMQYVHEREVEREGRVFSFYSFKGGVGKSILALNSAVILSKYQKKKTLLLDMDLSFGDIALLLNQHLEKTIIDLVDDDRMEEYGEIEPYLYQHNENLDILFAPKNPESAEYINKDILQKIMEKVRSHYDVIVVDTGVNFDETTLYLLDCSEMIFLVSSMEMASLKNTKTGMRVMKSLNYGNDKVKIVVNETSEKFGITKKDMEGVFDNKIFLYVPEDMKTVRLSVNKGEPICDITKNKGLKFTKALMDLCKKSVG